MMAKNGKIEGIKEFISVIIFCPYRSGLEALSHL
jgi:hypothetical protein